MIFKISQTCILYVGVGPLSWRGTYVQFGNSNVMKPYNIAPGTAKIMDAVNAIFNCTKSRKDD